MEAKHKETYQKLTDSIPEIKSLAARALKKLKPIKEAIELRKHNAEDLVSQAEDALGAIEGWEDTFSQPLEPGELNGLVQELGSDGLRDCADFDVGFPQSLCGYIIADMAREAVQEVASFLGGVFSEITSIGSFQEDVEYYEYELRLERSRLEAETVSAAQEARMRKGFAWVHTFLKMCWEPPTENKLWDYMTHKGLDSGIYGWAQRGGLIKAEKEEKQRSNRVFLTEKGRTFVQ